MITKAAEGRANSFSIAQIVTGAMFIALTYIATAFINIPSPIPAAGGLVHLGNVPLLIAAILYGKKMGAVSGAFGMALFDITSSWVSWAPFTFVIAGLMGYTAGAITEKKKTPGRMLLAAMAALFIKIAGYYMAEGILTSNWQAPIFSIPGNIIQVAVAAMIAIPLIMPLKAAMKKDSR